MIWLIRLYPSRWRERYGDELEQLVRDLQPSKSKVAIVADLLKGAFEAHIEQGLGMHAADRRAVTRATLIAGIMWLGLSVEIFLTNVVFPTNSDDDAVPVLVSYALVFAALFVIGVLAARDGAGRIGQAIAGLVGGLVIGALTVATFALVDNIWLDIVSKQQTKIDGFARSGASSMREFINGGLIGTAVGLALGLAVLGVLFALIGGLAGTRPAAPHPTIDG